MSAEPVGYPGGGGRRGEGLRLPPPASGRAEAWELGAATQSSGQTGGGCGRAIVLCGR